MDLNHTIVPAKDKLASASWFARIMGLKCESSGHFAAVRINDALTLDFAENPHMAHHHYAFHVSEEEFDGIFGRIEDEGLTYGSGPFEAKDDMQINHRRGGRGVYFYEINGHSIELLTTT